MDNDIDKMNQRNRGRAKKPAAKRPKSKSQRKQRSPLAETGTDDDQPEEKQPDGEPSKAKFVWTPPQQTLLWQASALPCSDLFTWLIVIQTYLEVLKKNGTGDIKGTLTEQLLSLQNFQNLSIPLTREAVDNKLHNERTRLRKLDKGTEFPVFPDGVFQARRTSRHHNGMNRFDSASNRSPFPALLPLPL